MTLDQAHQNIGSRVKYIDNRLPECVVQVWIYGTIESVTRDAVLVRWEIGNLSMVFANEIMLVEN